jgi:hypothetical protein
VGVPPPQLELPEQEAPAKRRRWPWIVTAVIVVLALLGGSYLLGHALGGRGQVTVWELRHDVPAGGSLGTADLVPVKVSKAAARSAVRTDGALPGTITKNTLRAGQLLPNDLLREGTPLPGSGRVLIGIAANPGAIPDGLSAGDTVTVLQLPVTTASGSKQPNLNAPATVLLQNIEVFSVVSAGSGSVATIVVPARSASLIASLSAQNRVSLTETR